MPIKKIQFLFSGESFKLPPFLTILDSLKDEYDINVLCYETQANFNRLVELYKANSNISFQNASERQPVPVTLISRVKAKLKRVLNLETSFHKKAKSIIEKEQYDKLWVIHENTLYEIRDLLNGRKYTLSMYELNDARGHFLRDIKTSVQQSCDMIVCEPNRAQILRTWMQLPYTPTVVPNKPLKHPKQRNITLKQDYNFGSKKIILYQGHIQKNRNLDAFCKAVSDIDDFTLVLMGSKTPYRDELERNFPNVKFIDFVNPPEHLNITSHAYIGIVKYDYVDLNSIFCAPNKTYEYAGFGIPMISNAIPGLVYSVGRYGAAECIDTDNVSEIKSAILKIDADYQSYERAALNFYESVDVKPLLNQIASR